MREAHDGEHPIGIVGGVEGFKDEDGRNHGDDEGAEEGDAPAQISGDEGKGDHAEERTGILKGGAERAGGVDAGLWQFLEGGGDEFRGKETNGPEADHSRSAQEQTDEGVAAPARVTEQFERGAQFFLRALGGFGLRGPPRIRFPESEHDGYDEEGRHDAREKKRLPAGKIADKIRGARFDEEAELRTHEVAERRKGLEHAQCDGAKVAGNAFRDQGGGGAEHSADAEADEKTVENKVKPTVREAGQTGKCRIDEQGGDHGFDAPDPIAHQAEEDAARGPAEHHPGGGVADVILDVRQPRRVPAQQFLQGGFAGEGEKALVHAIEQPARGGDDYDEPMVTGNTLEGTGFLTERSWTGMDTKELSECFMRMSSQASVLVTEAGHRQRFEHGQSAGGEAKGHEELNTKSVKSGNRPLGSAHAGVFLIGLQFQAHEDIIVGDGLHVFDVVVQAEDVAKAQQGEHFDGGLLLADEFGFEFFEAGLASEINHFGDHGAGQSAAAVIRKDEDADAANMAFPAAQLLVEGGVGDDFAVGEREQGKVASQVNVAAPIADDLGLGDAVFDEHALLGGNVEEKLMKRLFVVLAERA